MVDLSKLVSVSGKNYGEPLNDLVCVCGFENALSAGQLIDFDDLGPSDDGSHRVIIHTKTPR